MIAILPVRGGVLPRGADEAVAECGGCALLIGEGTADAAAALVVATRRVLLAEAGAYAAASWAAGIADWLRDREGDRDCGGLGGRDEWTGDAGEPEAALPGAAGVIVLPAVPDGRDLAPRLAVELGLPLWAEAVRAAPDRAAVARYGGRVLVDARPGGPYVATLIPGVAGTVPAAPDERAAPEPVDLPTPDRGDAEVLDVVPPTPSTIDLAEAPRVFAGGAGLGRREEFPLLEAVATAAGASLGATRVVADNDWVPFARQIGTTGTTIDPRLYVAFGISGAVQHITGIGTPEHVIAVNTDPSCPMMALADLAVVADAPSVLRELAALLDVPVPDAEPAEVRHG